MTSLNFKFPFLLKTLVLKPVHVHQAKLGIYFDNIRFKMASCATEYDFCYENNLKLKLALSSSRRRIVGADSSTHS